MCVMVARVASGGRVPLAVVAERVDSVAMIVRPSCVALVLVFGEDVDRIALCVRAGQVVIVMVVARGALACRCAPP